MATANFARVRLVRVEKNGLLAEPYVLPGEIADICKMSAKFFETVGYHPPWVGYVAFDGMECVGTCAFKGKPVEEKVEISYMTLKVHEGKGCATEMVRLLVEIARKADPRIGIVAQTMPERNASTRVLAKAGFLHAGDVVHPEDGLVAEWILV